MRNFISNTIDSVQSGLRQLSFQKRTSAILDGFNLDIKENISERDLHQMFHYNFSEQCQPFFIIGGMTLKNGREFDASHMKLSQVADWYAIIRPDDSSHIVFPLMHSGFCFNKKGQYLRYVSDAHVSNTGGQALQGDKYTGKPVMYSALNDANVLRMCESLSDNLFKKNRNNSIE